MRPPAAVSASGVGAVLDQLEQLTVGIAPASGILLMVGVFIHQGLAGARRRQGSSPIRQ